MWDIIYIIIIIMRGCIFMVKTRYGNARIYDGYWRISSCKEGNNGKLWHRLIWGDFYGCEVPEGYHIHHKNGNKLDNCILNLQLIHASEHHKLHNTGKSHSDETKKKMSENNARYWKGKNRSDETKRKLSEVKNTSGYLNVYKKKDNRYNQGFIWRYQYSEDGKRKCIYSVSLEKLEEKVKTKGLAWKELNEKC